MRVRYEYEGEDDCWQHGHEGDVMAMWSGGRVAHAGASHAYPDPGGIGTSDAGSLVESTHTFQGGGAIGTPFRGGKYIFFNFLYGVDIILIVKYYFMVFVKAVGAGKIYRRMFKRITLKTYRI